MKPVDITPFSQRKHEQIPIEKIVVLNSRNREKKQFERIVRNIKAEGLKKPILINDRNFKKRQRYELICGEGRYLACKELGHTKIKAFVVDFTKKRALLCSLIENIARVAHRTMWFAQEVKRLHDTGFSLSYIASITEISESYVRAYVNLVEQGEERLIRGVEQNLFPMSFAIRVAKCSRAEVQNVLMDAFDNGLVNCNNMTSVQRIIELRMNHGKKAETRKHNSTYTINELKKDIRKVTKEKEGFVHETKQKESRLYTLMIGLDALSQKKEWLDLLKSEGLDEYPQLQGNYDRTFS